MKKIYLFISLIFSILSFSQGGPGGSCATIASFCGDASLPFSNVTNTPSLGNIGCLGTSPNGAWYTFQVSTPGQLDFQISQTNAAGNGIDVDFICWGPFTTDPRLNPVLCTSTLEDYPNGSNASANNEVACSYSAAPVENFTITGAITGHYYVVLITNYANASGTITFDQTNNTGGSNGSTNCEICGVTLGPDRFICNNSISSVLLTATFYTPPTTTLNYRWYFEGVLQTTTTVNSLSVNQNGLWRVEVDRAACTPTEYDEIMVDISSGVATNPIGPFDGPAGECNPSFDLTSYLVDLMTPLNPSNYTFEFYDTSDGSLIPDPTNFTPIASTAVAINISIGTCGTVELIDFNVDCAPAPCNVTSLVSNSPICANDSAAFYLVGTPDATVSYTINGGVVQTTLLNATGNGTVVVPSVTIDQTILLTDITLGGCSTSLTNTITVVVNAPPVLVITNPAAVCNPATVDLTAAAVTAASTGGGVLSYWSDAAATVALASPGAITTSGTYYIQSTVGTCTDIEPVVVTVSPSPVQPTTSSVAPTCAADGLSSISNYIAGNTYVFSPTGPSVDATGLVSGMTIGTSYTVIANNGSCDSAASASFSNAAMLLTPAQPTITSVVPTCSADGISTISNYIAGNTYVFSPTGPSVDATGLVSGMTIGSSYTVIGNNGSCDSVISASFSNTSMLISPVLTITNPDAVCFSSSVDLTAAAVTAGSTGSGVLSYWSDAAGTIVLPSPEAIAISGTYYIKSTVGICTDIEPVLVTILPLATATISANTVCLGTSGTVIFSGTPNATITYTVDSGANQNILLDAAGNASLTTSVLMTDSIYTIVDVSVAYGVIVCNNPIIVSSTVNVITTTASFSTTNPSTCSGGSIVFDFIGTPNATVYFTDGSSNYNITLNPTGNFQYTSSAIASSLSYSLINVVSPSPYNCSQILSQSISITISLRPVITATFTTPICSGTATDIVINSSEVGTTYRWEATISNIDGSTYNVNGDETDINQIANVSNTLNPGSITMNVTPTSNGCSGNSISFVIIVKPNPVITNIVIRDNSVCSGEMIHLQVSGNPAGTSFNWQAITTGVTIQGGVTSGTTTGAIDLVAMVSNPAVAGSIYFEITPTRDGCNGAMVSSAIINVNPLPGKPIPAVDKEICSGELTNIIISVANPTIAGTIIEWYVLDSSGVSGASSGSDIAPYQLDDQLITTSNSQGYVVYRVKTILGECEGEYTDYRVYVNPIPNPVLENGSICVDASGITFQPYLLDGSLSGSYEYTWYLEGNLTPIEINTTGLYEVTVIGNYYVVAENQNTNCVGVSNTVGVVAINPATMISATASEAFTDNATVTVTVSGGNSSSYSYQIDDEAFQDSNIFTGVSSGLHVVTVIDPQGCTYLTTEVLVIDYPKFFTPNGDGYNEYWNIIGLENQLDAKLYIFDRYGKLLKQLSTAGQGWDGTFNGQLLPSSDYWFTLDFNEGTQTKQIKSHFSLKR